LPQPDGPEGVLPSTDGIGLPDGVRATPLARRVAREEGVNIRNVPGSGPLGRITKSDLIAYLESGTQLPAAGAAPLAVASLEDREIPLSRLRTAIGRRMTISKQQLPHFYVTHEYDMEKTMALRSQLNEILEPDGIKLSVNDFVLKAVAVSLREFPNLNASLGEDIIVQHGHINVGVAVAVEDGLLTVVCHDTDLKTLRQISVDVREKALRARDGKVQPDDVDGSTFTVSNLGMFDVEDFVAIINPPEAAILAVGAVKQVPVIKDGQVMAGYRMKATISVDHRVSDGAEAARFMQSLAKFMEDPLHFLAV
jgi:pyruvate dehydrogenase E2 component (dihydrolipoamide acetyltransferase)